MSETKHPENRLLSHIQVSGWKSLNRVDLPLRSINVLVGGNGAGKTNLVSLFDLLTHAYRDPPGLQRYVAKHGAAGAMLHCGSKRTEEIAISLGLHGDGHDWAFRLFLGYASPDRLVFLDEQYDELVAPLSWDHELGSIGEGQPETVLATDDSAESETAIRKLLQAIRVYHFSDTSRSADCRQAGYVEDNLQLQHDGGNLAAFLYRLKTTRPSDYRRILATVRQIAPFLYDFELAPRSLNSSQILLNWRQVGSPDLLFGPHQLSDGTLRAICLIALLLQPDDELPNLIVVDEPELGLHPYALNVIASLFQEAAHHVQILVSTQSSTLLDSFEPGDIIVVERDGEASKFTRPDEEALTAWLDDYSLGEVWEKNVIGGGPH